MTRVPKLKLAEALEKARAYEHEFVLARGLGLTFTRAGKWAWVTSQFTGKPRTTVAHYFVESSDTQDRNESVCGSWKFVWWGTVGWGMLRWVDIMHYTKVCRRCAALVEDRKL